MSLDDGSLDMVGWAQVVATAVAGFGLFYSAVSFRLQAKSNAMDWLFQFQERLDGSTKQIVDASLEARPFRLREHINFLEVCCLALHKKLAPKAVREIIEEAVVDNLATIQANEEWHGVLESNVTHPNTCKYIRGFLKKHRRAIDDLSTKRRVKDG